MTLVIADDHEDFRLALRAVLEASGRASVVAEAGTGVEAVTAAELHRPDIVLMDLRMPGGDGIEATRRIRAASPDVRVLVLTTFDEDELVRAAVDAGAAGYLLKGMPPDDLLAVIDLARRGYATFSPGVSAHDATPPDPRLVAALSRIATMTAREREILRLLGEGRTNGEIAAMLHLALGTVKNLVSEVLLALRVRHRTEAAILARLAREPHEPLPKGPS